MEIINQLKKNIEEQKEINEGLFKIFQYKMHEIEMQLIIEEWREGSRKVKAMIKELQEIELSIKEVKSNNSNTNTFINSYGEATEREITCSTYSRQQKKLSKDMLRFMS